MIQNILQSCEKYDRCCTHLVEVFLHVGELDALRPLCLEVRLQLVAPHGLLLQLLGQTLGLHAAREYTAKQWRISQLYI